MSKFIIALLWVQIWVQIFQLDLIEHKSAFLD